MNLDQDFACWLTTAASGAVGVLHMRAQPQRLSKTLSITLPDFFAVTIF
jgi:hypothetical protein